MNPAVTIEVSTKYLGKQQKSQQDDVYVFSYTVNIKNVSGNALKLLSRYWLITNGNGEKIEVKGEGVIGEQPTIQPNETYSYTSASMLKTEVGTMEGFYYFEDQQQSKLSAPIPVFSLIVPNSVH